MDRGMAAAEERQGLDPIQEAIRLFNGEYFFEAHEVLEDVWRQERGESRLFLQGLIQVCAAYHHFQNGNLVGAITLLERGSEKMRAYPPRYLGIDASVLLGRIDADRVRIAAMHQGETPMAPLSFPQITRTA